MTDSSSGPGSGDRVLVTGGAGFVGSSVVRALLERGCDVAALVEPAGDTANLDGLDVEIVSGDLRDAAAVGRAVSGSRTVFHVAALYRFWAPDPSSFYDINVTGTRNVLDAAGTHGVERLVYTSTVGTLGLGGATTDAPVDERSFAHVDHLFGLYKQSKYVAEHEVLRATAEGLPVVLVQPTTPVGPRDRGPTPTGRTVLEFLDGRIPGYVDTTLNIVDVEDVAAGHLLAADRGRVGRSYILGGENLALRDVLATLAAVTGLPAPTRRFPAALALAAGHVSGLVGVDCCTASRRSPWRGRRCQPPTCPSTTREPARSWGTRHVRPPPRSSGRPGGSWRRGACAPSGWPAVRGLAEVPPARRLRSARCRP